MAIFQKYSTPVNAEKKPFTKPVKQFTQPVNNYHNNSDSLKQNEPFKRFVNKNDYAAKNTSPRWVQGMHAGHEVFVIGDFIFDANGNLSVPKEGASNIKTAYMHRFKDVNVSPPRWSEAITFEGSRIPSTLDEFRVKIKEDSDFIGFSNDNNGYIKRDLIRYMDSDGLKIGVERVPDYVLKEMTRVRSIKTEKYLIDLQMQKINEQKVAEKLAAKMPKKSKRKVAGISI